MNFRNLTMMAASAVLGAICAGPVVAGNVLQTVQFPGVSAESLYKFYLSSSGHADAGAQKTVGADQDSETTDVNTNWYFRYWEPPERPSVPAGYCVDRTPSALFWLVNHKSCLPMHHRQPGNGAPHVRDRRGAQPTQVYGL
jgi:hypothetical protein